MKTVTGSVCTSSRLGPGGAPSSTSSSALYEYSVRAEDRAGKHHRVENEEMQACFTRLMQLVPTIPSHGRMSKVQLLQHVIDYILDLEHTLDFRPPNELLHRDGKSEGGGSPVEWTAVVGSNAGSPMTMMTPLSSSQLTPPDRKPLAENVQLNSLIGYNSSTSSFQRESPITWS